LKGILMEKRRGKVTKSFLFLHDYAPTDRALARQKKLTYLGLQCLDHPLFSGSGSAGQPPDTWTKN
jgi:hypothetical protein